VSNFKMLKIYIYVHIDRDFYDLQKKDPTSR
jgi:hypothetical protein